jgi:hypothetical protein
MLYRKRIGTVFDFLSTRILEKCGTFRNEFAPPKVIKAGRGPPHHMQAMARYTSLPPSNKGCVNGASRETSRAVARARLRLGMAHRTVTQIIELVRGPNTQSGGGHILRVSDTTRDQESALRQAAELDAAGAVSPVERVGLYSAVVVAS